MEIFAHKHIAVIGTGHMGTALIEGFIRSKTVPPFNIQTSNSSTNNAKAVKNADLIFLTVKPDRLKDVLKNIKHHLKKNAVVISAVAGVDIDVIQNNLNKDVLIVRIMPNLAVSIHQGIIGLFFHTNVSTNDKQIIRRLLGTLGKIVDVVVEEDFDCITLIGACGPGVVAYLLDTLVESYTKLGLSKKDALDYMIQNTRGVLSLLCETNMTPQQLLSQVATKGGITEAIIKHYHDCRIKNTIAQGLIKGKQKLQSS